MYESIEQIIDKHKKKESGGAPVQQEIQAEIESIGRTLGRKIIDLLVRDI